MSTQREQPNIILIMTDQQRVDTISAWECAHMTTPHMDRLLSRCYVHGFSGGDFYRHVSA